MNELDRQLKDKKIFITGGTGWLGKHLMDFLIKCNTQITCLSRDPEAFLQEYPYYKDKINFIKGKIIELDEAVSEFDYLIHMATPGDIEGEEQIIIDEAQQIINFSKRSKVKKILFTSSGAVYGIQPPDVKFISETYKCAPVTPYGKGKLQAEKLFLDADIPVVIARCFAFSGKHLPLIKSNMALGSFIYDALNGCNIEVNDSRPIRSYLDCDELAKWFAVLLLKSPENEIYNLGSDKTISIYELAEAVAKLSPVPIKINCKTHTDDSIPAPRYVPDISKIREKFGLKPETSLEESLHKIWSYFF